MVGRVFLGRYETIRLIGEGGMGRVYLARHVELDEPVVVKVMHEHIASNPIFRERFKREMKAMARFKHPNAVFLHDASLEDPQGPCIVMEYLPGVSLDRLLTRNERFTATRLRRMVTQLCDVLQAAHDLNIIHRDLKPANLMVLDADTPNEKIKVLDFGLAQMADPAEQTDVKTTVRVSEFAVGTPGYMSPEQVRGQTVDPRSDLYSLGAIVYQLLCGKLPFPGTTVMEILMAQASDDPPSLASQGADSVPPAVEDLLRATLAMDPQARPPSARVFLESYDAALTKAYVRRTRPSFTGDVKPPPDNPETPARAAGKPAAAKPAAGRDDILDDPNLNATVTELEAFMPEQIAVYKLQGFVEEVGGKIIKSQPGLIQVQLKINKDVLKARGGKSRGGLLSWLGFGPKYGTIDMELHMAKNPSKPNVVQIAVLLRPHGGGPLPDNPEWHDRCDIITTALKAYLMSQG